MSHALMFGTKEREQTGPKQPNTHWGGGAQLALVEWVRLEILLVLQMWWQGGFESSLLLRNSVCHFLPQSRVAKKPQMLAPAFTVEANLKPSDYLSLLSSLFIISLNNSGTCIKFINGLWGKTKTAVQQQIWIDTTVWYREACFVPFAHRDYNDA